MTQKVLVIHGAWAESQRGTREVVLQGLRWFLGSRGGEGKEAGVKRGLVLLPASQKIPPLPASFSIPWTDTLISSILRSMELLLRTTGMPRFGENRLFLNDLCPDCSLCGSSVENRESLNGPQSHPAHSPANYQHTPPRASARPLF